VNCDDPRIITPAPGQDRIGPNQPDAPNLVRFEERSDHTRAHPARQRTPVRRIKRALQPRFRVVERFEGD
jgi:hypothetical protein